MSNETIAIIFCCLAWACLVLSLSAGIPLFVIYSVAAIWLAHKVHSGVKVKK